MGFGGGMGLSNIRRCVDEMVFESTLDNGTRLEMKIYLQADETFRDKRQRNEEQHSNDT